MPPGRSMKPVIKPKDLKGTIRRMFSYVGRDKSKLAAVFVCIAVSAVISAVGTYMLKDIIDGYIRPLIGLENPDFGSLLYILAIHHEPHPQGALRPHAVPAAAVL